MQRDRRGDYRGGTPTSPPEQASQTQLDQRSDYQGGTPTSPPGQTSQTPLPSPPGQTHSNSAGTISIEEDLFRATEDSLLTMDDFPSDTLSAAGISRKPLCRQSIAYVESVLATEALLRSISPSGR